MLENGNDFELSRIPYRSVDKKCNYLMLALMDLPSRRCNPYGCNMQSYVTFINVGYIWGPRGTTNLVLLLGPARDVYMYPATYIYHFTYISTSKIHLMHSLIYYLICVGEAYMVKATAWQNIILTVIKQKCYYLVYI